MTPDASYVNEISNLDYELDHKIPIYTQALSSMYAFIFLSLMWTAGRLGRPVLMVACTRVCMPAPTCPSVLGRGHVSSLSASSALPLFMSRHTATH